MTETQKTEMSKILMEIYSYYHQPGMPLQHTNKVPQIEWSTSRPAGGVCYESGRIVLSARAYDDHGQDETINTFIHELAHLVHMNHSSAFWRLAHELGCRDRNAHNAALPTSGRYEYTCPNGHRIYKERPLRTTQSCTRCHPGRFSQAHVFSMTASPSDTMSNEELEKEVATTQAKLDKLQAKLRRNK